MKSLLLWIVAAGALAAQGDEYFPPEEAAEYASLAWPRLVELKPGSAVLQKSGDAAREVVPGGGYDGFEVVALLEGPEPMVVLERNFDRWGLLAYIGKSGPVARLRKPVGKLEKLPPPGAPFPAGYYDRLLSAQEDVLGKELLAGGREPSYESAAATLPPLDSYTFLGTVSSSEKIILQPDGRLDFTGQTLFDPWFRPGSPRPDVAWLPSKKGLVGGYLPVIDYAFFDPGGSRGFEEIAFAVGDRPELRVAFRRQHGKWTYSGSDAGTFYRDLLAVHREWENRLGKAMYVQIPERRVQDAAMAAIVRALISYVGLHPKYGAGEYWRDVHETFPPTTLLFNSLLLDWGFITEARERLGYYLEKFVKDDGTFAYYGPAVTEYGQMLALAVRCARLTGDTAWFEKHRPALDRIARRLLAQRAQSRKRQAPDSPTYGLLYGAAEADTRDEQAFYFSGDAWCWRGLLEMGQWPADASSYRADILKALQASRIKDFVPPAAGSRQVFERMTESTAASYTNYRYWLEMLSPELLPAQMRDAIIAYRANHGGELLATTRFLQHMDDWPYAHYAWGLLDSDQVRHYLLGFYGHLAAHTTPGTFTSYEQVAIKGDTTRRHAADYCVPVQLVTPQMLRWMLVWEPWSEERLWLARAVPQRWFDQGFSVRDVPTRWGPVSLAVTPAADELRAEIEMPASRPREVALRLNPGFRVTGAHLRVQGARDWNWDADRQVLIVRGEWKRVLAAVRRGDHGK